MNGDTTRLDSRITSLTESTEDKLGYLRKLIRDLEDRANQEESDRTGADSVLEDRIGRLEAWK